MFTFLLTLLVSAGAADSLGEVLRGIEMRSRGSQAAAAALSLGELHFARGEYEQAREAFQRAASRSTGDARTRARVEVGRALLALGRAPEARAAWAEVLDHDSTGWSRLGTALAWAMEARHDRALRTIAPLVDGPARAATAAALERHASWLEHTGRPVEATKSRDRLVREFPRSPEALRSARTRSEARR